MCLQAVVISLVQVVVLIEDCNEVYSRLQILGLHKE